MTEITKGVKFVSKNLTAYGNFRYAVNEWAEAKGTGTALCGDGMLHFYSDSLLAELMNPIHGAYAETARLFEVEVEGEVETDRGLKYGAKRLRLVREIERPKITLQQRVTFARLCASWAATAAKGSRQSPAEINAKLRSLAEEACAS